MKLWTIHHRGFSLTEGQVDHTLSPYVDTVPNYLEISQQLWDRLDTSDQVIQCRTKPADRRRISSDETEWVLEVPDAEIVAFIDDHVWNRILRLKCHPPKQLCDQWRDQALELFPTDSDSRILYRDEQERAYFAQEPPSGDWWNHVFVETIEGDSISAIIRHPMKLEWIIGRNPSA